jgi:hypothetical protein
MNAISLNNSVFSPTVVNDLPTKTKLAIKREGGEVIKNVIIAGLQEQGRAWLANTALESVGALSALEEHLCQIAPHGAGRYRAIVDAYALGAARQIARW